VVETNGRPTIEQSVRAAALYGQVVLLSVPTVPADAPGANLEISGDAYKASLATIRRVFVGSRADHEAMNRAISANLLRPVIDRVFGFDEAREAYAYYRDGAPFGKVVIAVA
jgi:NADPH:quinone reductase-like Zn-dependent oxidoreductase